MKRDFSEKELARAGSFALCLSGSAWIALAAGHYRLAPVLCPCMGAGSVRPSTSVHMLLAMNPPASLAVGWLLMLAAMMAPALIAPVWQIRVLSLARRRGRSIALFTAAYAAVWMVAGCVLLGIELAAELLAPSALLVATPAAIVALLWQCSPVKQTCLNRCHAHGTLSAFGAAADLSAIKFGLAHGFWCVGSCWALMLFPMLLHQGHEASMAIVGLFMWGERLERPRPPGWRIRGAGRAIRMVTAQSRIRLEDRRNAATA